jgi:C4-dicarboxylate-binding protein DctP
MNRLLVKTLVIAVVLAVLGVSGGEAQEKLVVKFSHVSPSSSIKATPKGSGADEFARALKERLKDRVEVQVFPSGQLYKDIEEMQALQAGSVQLLAPLSGKFTGWVPQFQLFDLPFIFPNIEAALAAAKDPRVGGKLFEMLETKGLKGLAIWPEGFKQLSNSKHPLVQPSDLKGLKMRIHHSDMLEAQYKGVGATTVFINFSDLYQALERGVADGQENPLWVYPDLKYQEVQRHLSVTNHGFMADVVVTSLKFWNGLSAEDKKALMEAVEASTDKATKVARAKDEESLQAIRAAGKMQVRVLTKDELKAWREAWLPVHKKFENVIGKDLLEATYQIAKQYE